jgi:hypothetical protein
MKNNLSTIRNRIAEIKHELSEIGAMRPGSVCCQYRDREKKRSAFYQLSYTYRGKSHTKHVRPEEVSDVQEQTARYKRFKSLVAEWTALSLRECELMQQQKREETHESDPEKVAKVAVSDPDARVLKNKEGGWALNYTPVVSTDGYAGFIVSTGVTNSTAEYPFQIQALSDIKEMFDDIPQYMMGDGLYTDVETVHHLESNDVIPLAPVESTGAVEGDAAYREDPSRPVPSDRIEMLPVSKKKQRFTRKAF